MHLRLELDSLEATVRVGQALGQALPERALVLVYGAMGAGKTTLIKSICAGLGIAPEVVISPTYTLVNVYPGPISAYHVDLYRLEHPQELAQLDRQDWINPAGITLIEWPELAEALLAGEAVLRLTVEDAGPSQRRLTLSAEDARYAPVFTALAAV